jgi:two-component system, cell cycle sensor histidine kinase and response regulator CckA
VDKKKADPSHAEQLRRQAEARLRFEEPLPAEISPAETKKLIHELRVHQIELEMQNDELRQAQAILEESRSRYSDLYDFAPIGYLALDELGIIKEANLTAARVLAVERTRLIDRQLTHFMVTEDRGTFRRHLNLVLKGRERETVELRLKREDGKEIFILLESIFHQDTEGKSLCRTAFSDITKRRQVEADLQASEARYRSLFQNNHAVMLLIDPATGDIVDANPAASAFYGYTHAELISRKITDINMLPKDQVFKEMQRAGLEQRRHFFFRHRLAGGEERDVEVFSGPIRVKDQNLLYSIVHDITARKQAETALQRTQEELQIIFDSVPAMIFYKDEENRFIRTNQALAEATGLPREELDGKSLFDLYPSQADDYWKNDQEVMRRGNAKRNIIETLETPRGVRWVQTDKIPYRDAQGNIIGIIGFAVDITERKRAEEERAKLDAQLQESQRLKSLGVLAGGIAHDFNNLLMAILGNADLALDALPPGSPVRPSLKEISRASLRAADLCHQMLTYSGKGRFVVGHYELSEIVREMWQILEVAASKKAALHYAFGTDLPVEVDATKIRQVMANLVTNASEALGDQGGIISVSTGVMDCDRAYLSGSHVDDNLPEGKYVYLEVADTGSGIDAEARRRIFEPFFTTKFMGRGLGLSAVLGIVRGHRGAIKVHSEVGQGSTFTVLLPAKEWDSGDQWPSEAPSDQQVPSGRTILLIDDEPDVRSVGSRMLDLLGFKVLTAAGGREGLEVFQGSPDVIDCVILDLIMPEMNGEEVFRELRLLRPDVRVILSSGFNAQEMTQQFVGQGLAGFIQKPYRVTDLQEVLNRVLD